MCCFSIVPALFDLAVIQLVGTKSSVKHSLQGLSLFLPLDFASRILFVRSHSTEETCKGVRVQKDASDSWFDSMSHIFSFS